MDKEENNIIVVDSKKLNSFKSKVAEGGLSNFYIVSDFDRTVTRLFVGGEKVRSMISILYNGNYLSPQYNKEAQKLCDYYHPIEIDSKISPAEKNKAMEKWWSEHLAILVKFGLNKKHLEEILDSGKMQLRKGAAEFFEFLNEHQIPLLFISSSGLGIELISMFLKKEKKLYPNIHIISNILQWDEAGNFIGPKKPIIHCCNKDATAIHEFPVFEKIKNRRNVLLLGDNIEDCQMSHGLDFENLLQIGFLNEKIDENLAAYKNTFDVLILDDGSLEYVNKLLREMF